MNPNYQAHLQQRRALPPPLLTSEQKTTSWNSTVQPPGLSPRSNSNTSFQGRPQQFVHVTPQRTNHQVQFEASGRPPTQEPLIRNFFTLSPTGKRIFCPEDSLDALDNIPDGYNLAHPAPQRQLFDTAPQRQLFDTRGGYGQHDLHQHRLDPDAGVPLGPMVNGTAHHYESHQHQDTRDGNTDTSRGSISSRHIEGQRSSTNDDLPSNTNEGHPCNTNMGQSSNSRPYKTKKSQPPKTNESSKTNKSQPSKGRPSKTNKGQPADSVNNVTTTNSSENNDRPRPNMREVNRILKNLVKDRLPRAPQTQSTGQSTLVPDSPSNLDPDPGSNNSLERLNLNPQPKRSILNTLDCEPGSTLNPERSILNTLDCEPGSTLNPERSILNTLNCEPGSTLNPGREEGVDLGPEEALDLQDIDYTEARASKLAPIPDDRFVHIGQGVGNNNEDDRPTPLVDDEEMEEILGMDLDELRMYEALHATNRRLPASLKAELDEMYYEFERQLHILAIRHLLHAMLLYTHIGQVNRMRGGTNYNNFCRFDPEARVIFSSKDEPLKERCKEVARVWGTMDPDMKMKYKDPAFIETIWGDIPMTVVNGVIQTARKAHVANTTLNLASNKKSVTFVRKWAKDTIDRMNEIAGCHHIQGMLVIASGKSSGDLFITGGTRLGVNFLNMLMAAGDPLRKFHTYAAGMSVVEELMGQQPALPTINTSNAPGTLKRKHPDMVGTGAEIDKTGAEVRETDNFFNTSSMKKDKYCQGSLKDNKKLISIKLLEMLNCAAEKHFRGWPGLNCARELQAANIQVKIKKNSDDFIADELFQPIKAIKIVPSQRILRAIGEGWICLKYQEEDNVSSPPAGSNGDPDERAPKRSKRTRASQKQTKKSKRVSHDSDDDSEEQLPQFDQDEEDEDEDEYEQDEYEQDDG
ncbi:hypothetical protein MJO28_002582 [Puccinia striiformis f. sp. tritici]|uniref:Uncharacterized protein n=1 Tax=Puccinia striiformis f. sp. tritici TaxID=168172 RepID=A0ACC0ERZ9_9BASI|nr:hypothetical protein MJO28_002582 [Puccinia striiformis f. sp. tritici]